MKILFCVPDRVTTSLGGPKVYVELSQALEGLGCSCELVGIDEIAPGVFEAGDKVERSKYYAPRLRDYIRDRADEFDVIEYEHPHLPFPRSDFPDDVLLVARSVLLVHHERDIRLPMWRGLPGIAKNLLQDVRRSGSGDSATAAISWRTYGKVLKKHIHTALRYRFRGTQRADYTDRATATCKSADLVNVCNSHDQQALLQAGVDEKKIVKLPFGLTESRCSSLASAGGTTPSRPSIALVGTHDFRKGGATDLPSIVQRVLLEVPEAKFLLLGTQGLFQSEEEVLAHFRPIHRPRIRVVPQYDPNELPDLLADATLGVFPSYFEGFPFGVLEMTAAGLPVVAYNAPGAPEMLPDALLAPLGNWRSLAKRVIACLRDRNRLKEQQENALQRASAFKWRRVAEKTLDLYEQHRNINLNLSGQP